MNCIDVRTLGRYRTGRSQDHIDGTNIDPWNLEIQCRFGKVYPHGGEYLQAYTDRRLKRGVLRDVPGVTLHQWGDTECTVVFPVSVLPAVLGALKPRMRRTLSPEQRARKVEILRQARGLRGQGATIAPPPTTTLATGGDRALTGRRGAMEPTA